MPDAKSEDEPCVGVNDHGQALCGLPLDEGGPQLLATIVEACGMKAAFESLSPIKTGFWPVILVACRHHQLPIPPGFWIESLIPVSEPGDALGSMHIMRT
jgi:hypothetical protein